MLDEFFIAAAFFDTPPFLFLIFSSGLPDSPAHWPACVFFSLIDMVYSTPPGFSYSQEIKEHSIPPGSKSGFYLYFEMLFVNLTRIYIA
jgi:hypothetical protein